MVASLILRSETDALHHELATFAPPGPIAARLRAGSRCVTSLAGVGGGAGSALRLARLLRRRRYDVVTAHGLKASVIARVLVRVLQPKAAFICGVRGRHVSSSERLDSPKARLASVVERVFSPLVDVYDANSRGVLELLSRLGIESDRLVWIPNGLDLALWAPPDADGQGTGDDPPLIFCAARFMAVKRHQDLLHALAVLKREGYSFRTVLVGAGPTLSRMRALAGRLGLESLVTFPGVVEPDRVHSLLGEATIASLPSAGEGMPGSLMEAMARGVPVVGTAVSGIDELIVDGESGLLVPPYDPPALAEALGELLRDQDLRARLGAGGRRRMEECFSLENMISAKQRLYCDVAGRTRPRRLGRARRARPPAHNAEGDGQAGRASQEE